MFCNKCGKEFLDDKIFCSKCGERLSSESTPVQGKDIKTTLSITEYFEHGCSNNATKRQSYLKGLLRASIILQIALFLLGIILNIKLFFVFPPLLISFFLGIVFATGSILCIKNGLKKKSSGQLFASMILAFISTCFGTAFAINIPSVNRIIVLFSLVLHIVSLVLNSKDIKEYKEYLTKSKAE